MQAGEIADFEIERRLDSYARARLSPDPQALARIRARVMREARLQFEPTTRLAVVPPAIEDIQRGRHGLRRRRLTMTVLAASLWLGIMAGSVAATQAGGPLYPTRVWLETVTLPAGGTARAVAEVGRLDARLREAASAAARGDAPAVEAALGAYAAIADEAIAASAGDASIEAVVAAALDRHAGQLNDVAARLADRGNPVGSAIVAASVQRAIARNAAVLQRLQDRVQGGGGAPVRPPGTGRPAAGGGGAGSGSGRGKGPEATPGGRATPTATPRPTPTPTPKPKSTKPPRTSDPAPSNAAPTASPATRDQPQTPAPPDRPRVSSEESRPTPRGGPGD